VSTSRERIYRAQEREFPRVLVRCDEFVRLNEAQRFNYRARLRYIEEITLKVEEWVNGGEPDFFAFLDSVELDLYINQGCPADPATHVSAWLIHTSWGFETSVLQMSRFLSTERCAQIESPQPKLGASVEEFRAWMQDQNQGLKESLNGFFGAVSFHEAMASQFAIDALLLNLLSGVAKARLNKRLDSLRP
jgi:hypothetical protein